MEEQSAGCIEVDNVFPYLYFVFFHLRFQRGYLVTHLCFEGCSASPRGRGRSKGPGRVLWMFSGAVDYKLMTRTLRVLSYIDYTEYVLLEVVRIGPNKVSAELTVPSHGLAARPG